MEHPRYDLDVAPLERARLAESACHGGGFTIAFSALTDHVEHELNFALAAVLKCHGKDALHGTLYSCLKELAVNAVKANAKKVFFAELGLDPADPAQYKLGIEQFKRSLSEAWVDAYCRKAHAQGFFVDVVFIHDANGLRLEVVNFLALLAEDEKRIREKFARGMKYEDLVSFYLDHADETEGEGIGFALNVLLLKGEDIDPALFRVGVRDGRTIARLEIPFTKDFVSVRGAVPGKK